MKTAVETILEDLNPQQRKAVCHGEGPLLVFAGAGSGKTRVLSYRTAYLLATGQTIPSQILAMTFTNKAAEELKERIANLLGRDSSQVWAGTFHSFCARLLRRHIDKLGQRRNFTIFDEGDQRALVKQSAEQLGLSKDFSPAALLYRIDRAKNNFEDAESILSIARADPFESAAARVYSLYQKKLRQNNAVDFGDLIMLAVRLLENDNQVKEEYQTRFTHLLIDEYQDINPAQYRLVRAFTRSHRNLCVVGDDDQSIYGWRGADVGLILRFQDDFPDATVVKLEQNYRSTQVILDAAYHVIKQNIRAEKKLWTDNGGGEPISLFEAPNEQEEAFQVASMVKMQMEQEEKGYSDFAILYRTNAQSRVYEEAFANFRIPYRLVGSMRFYDRAEVKDILAYLRAIQNPSDSVSLRRIINTPRRGIGDTTLERLEQFVSSQALTLFEALEASRKADIGLGRNAKAVQQFAELLDKLIQKRQVSSLADLVHDVIVETGYKEGLEKERTPEAMSRLENLEELERSAYTFQESFGEDALTAFLERASLMSSTEAPPGEADVATLMTMHSAKGLEFDTVFMVGMEEGLFPHSRSSEEDELEEERRLCYVGLTRAKHKVYLSYATSRIRFGGTEHTIPSRFLQEIPDELLDKSGCTPYPTRAGIGRPHRGQGINLRNIVAKERKQRQETQRTSEFQPGDKVTHVLWGRGTVVKIPLVEGDDTLTVAFESVGIKKLAAAYAPLEKIS